jgi:hypothetical protein
MIESKNAVAWLTPHAVVAREDGAGASAGGQLEKYLYFRFNADGKEINAFARSHYEHLLEISDVVLRLLAASVVHTVELSRWSCQNVFSVLPAWSI